VRETLSATASTSGLICSDVDGCVDGEDDGLVDGCFDFDDLVDPLAVFDRGEVPVVWNTLDAKAAVPSKEEDVQTSAAASASAASVSAAGASDASACFSNPAKMWEIKATYNMPGMKNTLVRTTGNLNMAALGKQHYARLIHMIVPQLPAISRG
jgi:hypothetical protein